MPKNFSGKRKYFSTNYFGLSRYSYFFKKKKQTSEHPTHLLKINLRWLINLNIKAEIMKLIKAYIETYFHHLRVAKMCEIWQRSTNHKNLNFIKIKICSFINTIMKMHKHTMDWKKIFTIKKWDRELCLDYIKKYNNSITQRHNQYAMHNRLEEIYHKGKFINVLLVHLKVFKIIAF